MSDLFDVVSDDVRNPTPDYLKGVTLRELCNFYFNWHPHQAEATLEEIEKWFKQKRGWTWKQK